MGKASAKQEIAEYRMSYHLGFCLGADAMLRLTLGDKDMWTGRIETEGAVFINQPDLFGGPKREGGPVGHAYFLPGKPDQVLPDVLANRMGKTSANCPAYRGIASVFFVGTLEGTGEVVQTVPGAGVGLYPLWSKIPTSSLTYSLAGFLWGNNQPFLQAVAGTFQRYSRGLNPDIAYIENPDKTGWFDSNPAHMIYECYTNQEWGGQLDGPTTIDVASFEAAAQTLYDEGFGLSMAWFRQAKIEDFVQEILDHIQAMVFLDPTTGLITLKLIRNDYDPDDLIELTPDTADLSNFDRRLPGETINEIVVSFTNPLNEQEETVTLQDQANIAMQEGAIISDPRQYYGIRHRGLAASVCARDLRSAAALLATAEAELDRRGWSVKPGSCVKLTWPEYGLDRVIMRVMKVNYGRKGAGKIRLSLVEDVFALEHSSLAPPASEWSDEAETPAPMTYSRVFTLPAYFLAEMDIETQLQEIEDPEVIAGVLAAQPGRDTTSYELLSEEVTSTGATVFVNKGTRSLVGRSTLPSAFVAEAVTTVPISAWASVFRGPAVGKFLFIGAGGDGETEIAMLGSHDGTNWTIHRGLFDTIPAAWAAGTPVWFVSVDDDIADDQTIRAAGETPEFKLLTTTSKGTLSESAAPVISPPAPLTSRPHRPLRPANVKVNGVGFGSVNVSAATNITVTWATRNRLLEDGAVMKWTDAPVTPEHHQQTVVAVYDHPSGALLLAFTGLWTENSLTFPKSYLSRYASVRIDVGSERDGLYAASPHSIVVTGLPNNPTGPALPTLPPPAPPPDAILPPPQPGAGAFTATGTAITSAQNASVPAIIVTGSPDSAEAARVVVRYRKNGTTDWSYEPLADTYPAREEITSVAPNTVYNVQVGYKNAQGDEGPWLALANVTTGTTRLPNGGIDGDQIGGGAVGTPAIAPAAVTDAIVSYSASGLGISAAGGPVVLQTATLQTQGGRVHLDLSFASGHPGDTTNVLPSSSITILRRSTPGTGPWTTVQTIQGPRPMFARLSTGDINFSWETLATRPFVDVPVAGVWEYGVQWSISHGSGVTIYDRFLRAEEMKR